jgi:hypothetical protein
VTATSAIVAAALAALAATILRPIEHPPSNIPMKRHNP